MTLKIENFRNPFIHPNYNFKSTRNMFTGMYKLETFFAVDEYSYSIHVYTFTRFGPPVLLYDFN